MILLQVDPAFSDKLEIVHEGWYKTKDTSIFAWFLALGIGHYCWLRSSIRRLPLNSKVDYIVRTICRILNFFYSYELSLWHCPRFNMYLQLCVRLIHNLNKCFSHNKTFVTIDRLSHYHIIYLIVKLIQINLMFIRLEDYFISIGPFINTLSIASWISNILATH